MRNLLAQAVNTEFNLKPGGEALTIQELTLPQIVSGFITFALIIAAIVFFFMLVVGGIRWITSGGDKGQTETARNQITAALIGLVIVFAAWAIAQLVGSFFGFSVFNLTLPTLSGLTPGTK